MKTRKFLLILASAVALASCASCNKKDASQSEQAGLSAPVLLSSQKYIPAFLEYKIHLFRKYRQLQD